MCTSRKSFVVGVFLGITGTLTSIGFMQIQGCNVPDTQFVQSEIDRAMRDANTDAANMTDAQTQVITAGQQDIVSGQKEVVGAIHSTAEGITAEHAEMSPEKAEQLAKISASTLAAIQERLSNQDTLIAGIGTRQSEFSTDMGEWKGSRAQAADDRARIEALERGDISFEEYALGGLLSVLTGGSAVGVARKLGSRKEVEALKVALRRMDLANAVNAGEGQRFAGDKTMGHLPDPLV